MLAPLADTDPRNVGPYQVHGRLGAGGMGAVYLGFGPGGAPVALKVIRPDLVNDARFRERFRREVAAAGRVRGRFVAQVRDADVEAASPWMATDYVEGVSLAAAVTDHEPLQGPMLTGLAGGLANALAAVHAAGLVHRDLKPSNILLAWDGPKVIDFGIARALDSTSYTSTGDVLGTASWMSPEQLRGERVGPAADVFAWAMCVVFAARGRHAFPSPSPAASAMRVLSDPPDLAGVPESLVPLLTSALDKDPSRRPDAVTLVSALAGRDVASLTDGEDAFRTLLVNGWAVPTPPPVPGPLTAAGHPASLPTASPPTFPAAAGGAEPAAKSPRGRRRVFAAAAAVLVTASGLLAWLLVPGGGHDRQATAVPLLAQQRTATAASSGTTAADLRRPSARPTSTGGAATQSGASSPVARSSPAAGSALGAGPAAGGAVEVSSGT
ncbi:MAG: serine/threonine-protein kinase, partial [Frankia sp.]